MPYLHWEESGIYYQMRAAIKRTRETATPGERVDAEASTTANEADVGYAKDENLLRAYLHDNQNLAVHVRRTLDQSYYSTLDDTTDRDKSQVVQGHVKKKLHLEFEACPMLMVDQCWVWILEGSKFAANRGPPV